MQLECVATEINPAVAVGQAVNRGRGVPVRSGALYGSGPAKPSLGDTAGYPLDGAAGKALLRRCRRASRRDGAGRADGRLQR